MKEVELKPCPFCGGRELLLRDVRGMFGRSAYARTYRYIQCRSCFSQTGYYGTKPKTVEAWNRRVDNERTQMEWLYDLRRAT